MKKSLSLMMLFCFSVLSLSLSAQCPKNKTTVCQGECGRYIDEDNNNNCDISDEILKALNAQKEEVKEIEEEPKQEVEIVKETKKEVVKGQKKEEAPKPEPKQEIKKEEKKKEDKVEEETKSQTQTTTQTIVESVEVEKSKEITAPEETKKEKPYRFWEILLATIIAYSISVILVKTKTIKKYHHRKFWNYILLITFVIACLLGLFLVVQINYGIAMKWFAPFLKNHVDFGIAMTVCALIHIFWHRKYLSHWSNKAK